VQLAPVATDRQFAVRFVYGIGIRHSFGSVNGGRHCARLSRAILIHALCRGFLRNAWFVLTLQYTNTGHVISVLIHFNLNYSPTWSCSKAVYKPVWHIPFLSVQWINSWWWTGELSETCTLSCQNKFVKLVPLVGIITKKFVTIQSHMNVKKKDNVCW
jgi:hypothetical protein